MLGPRTRLDRLIGRPAGKTCARLELARSDWNSRNSQAGWLETESEIGLPVKRPARFAGFVMVEPEPELANDQQNSTNFVFSSRINSGQLQRFVRSSFTTNAGARRLSSSFVLSIQA